MEPPGGKLAKFGQTKKWGAHDEGTTSRDENRERNHRDAARLKRYGIEVLGFCPENVIELNASAESMITSGAIEHEMDHQNRGDEVGLGDRA